MPDTSLTSDPWRRLRRHTPARIALGRAGGSLPTSELLQFALDHAEARDAVHSELDFDRLEQDVKSLGLDSVRVQSAAPDRVTYLRRPDLGRRLSDQTRSQLAVAASARQGADAAIVIADGLSAFAAQSQAPRVLLALVPRLRSAGRSLAPLTFVRHGRVAVEDEIGAAWGARAAIILLGERPGLGSADSLGAYLVFNPTPGNTDAHRNCVSNIRPSALQPEAAAELIAHLLGEAIQRRLSGVELKDERQPRDLVSPAAGRLSP